jgi:hypothetical protein
MLALSNLPCGRHRYSSNRHVTVLTTILLNIKFFVHYTDGLTYTAMLFLLQGVYKLYAPNNRHKYTQLYLL